MEKTKRNKPKIFKSITLYAGIVLSYMLAVGSGGLIGSMIIEGYPKHYMVVVFIIIGLLYTSVIRLGVIKLWSN